MISGEFWIDDSGGTTFADGDVGDANHQSIAFEAALGISLDSPDRGQPELIPMDKFDDDAAEWLLAHGASKEAVEYLKDGSDPRDYALEHMGWIRVQGDNFQMWDFDDEALDRIKGFDEWENVEDPEGLEESEDTINIEQHKDNKMWTVSLKELFRAKSAEGLKRYKDGIGKWRNPGNEEDEIRPPAPFKMPTCSEEDCTGKSPVIFKPTKFKQDWFFRECDECGDFLCAEHGVEHNDLLFCDSCYFEVSRREKKEGKNPKSDEEQLIIGAKKARKAGDLKAAKLLEREARRIAKGKK